MSSDGQNSQGSLLPILGVVLVAGIIGAVAWVVSDTSTPGDNPRDEQESNITTDSSGGGGANLSSSDGTRSVVEQMRPPLKVVVRDDTGSPIEGATVSVFKGPAISHAMQNGLKEYQTDSQGEVTVESPAINSWVSAESDGKFRVIAELKGYQEDRIEFTLTKGAALKIQTIEDNSDKGTPIEGFTVRLHALVSGPPPTRNFFTEVLTDADGFVLFDSVPTSPITVILDSPEFDFVNEKVQIPAGTEDLKIYRLSRKTSVQGVVVSALDGVPIPGATVRCAPNAAPRAHESFGAEGNLISKAVADENGRFLMNNVGHGKIFFEAIADGFGEDVFPVELTRLDSGTTMSRNGQKIDQVRVELSKASTVSGRVVDTNSQPLKGIEVRLENPLLKIFAQGDKNANPTDGASIVTTDAKGAFVFENVLARTPWVVGAIHPEFIPEQTKPIKLTPGQQKTDILLTLRRGGVITGEVVDTSGAPLAGATVSAYERPNSPKNRRPPEVKTDAQGAFRMVKVPEGIFMVNASLEGYVDSTRQGVRHTATGVRVQLRKSAAVQGVVVNAEDQQPITNFDVRYRTSGLGNSRASNRESFDSPKGEFLLSNVPPGVIDIEVRAKGFSHNLTYGVTVSEGQTEGPLNIQMGRGAYIEGYVTDAQGNPVPRAVVELDPADRFDNRDRDYNLFRDGADDTGFYKMDALLPGNYELTVVHSKYAQLRPERIAIREGEPNRRDITLQEGAKVIVYVYDSLGEPIEGARALLRDKDLPPQISSPQGGKKNLRQEPFRDLVGSTTGASGRNTSDRNGRILFYRQPAGDFVLTVYAKGFKRFTKNMSLNYGQKYDERVTLEPAGSGDGGGPQ